MIKEQLRDLIERTLDELTFYSGARITCHQGSSIVDLLMMTAAHESRLGKFLVQQGGPALGIFQMEPATHLDIYENYLKYEPDLYSAMGYFNVAAMERSGQMEWNLMYAIVMARMHYWRVKAKLPTGERGLAEYAKEHWNTIKGAAHVSDYLTAYKELVQ